MAKEYGITIAFRVEPELHDRIQKQQAAENRRVISEMVRILLTEALERREAKVKRGKR